VDHLPAETCEDAAAISKDEPFVAVWGSRDPEEHAGAIAALEQENIPARTVQADDYLFIPRTRLPFEVYVPKRFAERAKKILDAEEDAAGETTEVEEISNPLEDLEDSSPQDPSGFREKAPERGEWHPDDATAEIWSGENAAVADMIRMSLRENQIPCLLNSGAGEEETETSTEAVMKVFVLPEDEARAKEIVKEIADAAPPE
jgi:hypothetical protein